ncbi:glycosyltransferase family 87 protein [Terrabacter sp. Ter38]|uniref:glycosyltransferase family 87 protein n=1 Tax=Terrabacter sp. Ter38 TaxID=2926030 RepID=UPI002117C7AB|nr:glycosyltransferase family 87 protein [Terrabacter sp. Ter38]
MLWLAGAYLVYVTVSYYVARGRLGGDAHAYWLTGQSWYVPYEIAPNRNDAFLYSPVFAQVVHPLTLLPWPSFLTVWMAAETAAFVWLLRPLGWKWALPLVLWCAPEIVIGNVLGFLGVALVVSFTQPWLWSAMFLTKPVFGVGTLWFAARREWHRFAVAIGSTGLVVGVSALLDPEAWVEWIRFLAMNAGGSATALVVRTALAVAIVLLAARKGQRWPMPVALLVATPVFVGAPSLTILAAVPRLLSPPRERLDDAARPDDAVAARPMRAEVPGGEP